MEGREGTVNLIGRGRNEADGTAERVEGYAVGAPPLISLQV
jgi:hypothetical protein